MKIDLTKLPSEGLIITKHMIAGEECTLIRPDFIGFDWTEDTLHFRSSMWNSEGELISASFKKFFNYEEKPAVTPPPKDDDVCEAIEKLDGSALIVSKYKGQLIVRTRGSHNTEAMINKEELPVLMEKYRNFFFDLESGPETRDLTYIFEWVSPKNRIVISYPEPELYLIATIRHRDYSMQPQHVLDATAIHYEFKRPKAYTFTERSLLFEDIKKWEDKEGICLYYNGGQSIRKIKSLKYLKLHAFKSLLSLKNLAKIFYEYGCPTEQEFKERIEKDFDFECAKMALSIFPQLYSVFAELCLDVKKVQTLVDLDTSPTQKEFALKLIEFVNGKSYLSGYGFKMKQKRFEFKESEKAFLELIKKIEPDDAVQEEE